MANIRNCRHCGGGMATETDLLEHEQNCLSLDKDPDRKRLSCNGHERIYEDGSGYICRHCGIDMDDED